MKVHNDVFCSVPNHDDEAAFLLLEGTVSPLIPGGSQWRLTWTPLRISAGMRESLSHKDTLECCVSYQRKR